MSYLSKHVITINEPATEPCTAAGFRSFTQIQGDNDDALLADILKAARVACELYTNRPFIETTFAQIQDNFDKDVITGSSFIKAQKSPLVSVSALKVYDRNNEAVTLDASSYNVSLTGGKVFIKEPSSIVRRESSSVELVYVAGFGADATGVPEDIKTAIYIYAHSVYDPNRPAEQRISQPYTMPEAAKNILSRYRLEIGIYG